MQISYTVNGWPLEITSPKLCVYVCVNIYIFFYIYKKQESE